MTQYTVINRETDYEETFFNLTSAKKAMKDNNAQCFKTKIYRDGTWIPCGEVKLKGSNKTFIANSFGDMKKENY